MRAARRALARFLRRLAARIDPPAESFFHLMGP